MWREADGRFKPYFYLAIAVVWSWTWWGVSIATGGTETAAGGISWLIGGFGPTVAVVTALRRATPQYRSDFKRRLLRWQTGWKWWAAALLLASGPKLIALASTSIAGHSATGESMGLAALPVALVFGLVAVSIEEPLWRGIVLDGLKSSPARASLIIGVVWATWHIPLFAVEGTFQGDLGFGTIDFFVFLAGVVGLSVFLTWLVNHTGSILIALFMHFAVNLTGEFLPDDTTVRAIEMAVILAIAVVLLPRLRTRNGPASASDAVRNPTGRLAVR